MAIHIFDSTGDAYDACQCDENVTRGDILYIPSENVVGLADTWPVAITKEYGQLHTASAAGELTGDAAILATLKYLTDAHQVEKRKRLALVDVTGETLFLERPGAGKYSLVDRAGNLRDTFTIDEFEQILLAGSERDGTLTINW